MSAPSRRKSALYPCNAMDTNEAGVLVPCDQRGTVPVERQLDGAEYMVCPKHFKMVMTGRISRSNLRLIE